MKNSNLTTPKKLAILCLIVFVLLGVLAISRLTTNKPVETDGGIDYILFQDTTLNEILLNQEYDAVTYRLSQYIFKTYGNDNGEVKIENAKATSSGVVNFEVLLTKPGKKIKVNLNLNTLGIIKMTVPETKYTEDIKIY